MTSQDVELVKQVTRFGFVDTDRFNGGAKIANISLTTVYYGDKVFVDPRSLRVYINVHIVVYKLKKIIGMTNKLPGNGTRCYQVISILSGTKSILSAHLCSDG